MGNRGVITTRQDLAEDGVGLYLHWNGGRDSVEAFLDYCRLRGFRGLPDDYGYARLAQVIGNFLGGEGLSVGLGPVKLLDQDNYDNGVYLVRGWEIEGRLYLRGSEQQNYDHRHFLVTLDGCQPEGQRIGERMIDDLLLHGVTLGEAAQSYHYSMDRRKEEGKAPEVFEAGRRYKEHLYDKGPGFGVLEKSETHITAEIGGETQTCPLFHWADGGESAILALPSGPWSVEPYPKP